MEARTDLGVRAVARRFDCLGPDKHQHGLHYLDRWVAKICQATFVENLERPDFYL